MGFLQGLLDSLGGATDAMGVGLSAPGGITPGGGMTEAVMGFPAIARGGPVTTPPFNPDAPIPGMPNLPDGPITSPTEASDESILVEGWAPTKRNIIGRLGDAFLMAQGKKPIYEQRMQDRDIKRAMKGFASNPEESIRRVMQVDPDAGMKLYNQYVDNKRADDVQTRLRMLQEEKYRDNIAAMLGAANENNYGAMLPRIRQYATNRGIDVSELPDTYDPDAISMWRMGGMTVDQQIDNDRADAREERMGDQFATTQRGIQNRFETTQANITAREQMKEEGRDRRSSASIAASGRTSGGGLAGAGVRVFKDREGTAYVDDKAGRMVVDTGDGKLYRYTIKDGKKKLVDIVPKK